MYLLERYIQFSGNIAKGVIMGKELKLCPFCGSNATILEQQSGDNPKIYFRVNCLNINCSMGYPDAWYDDKSELIEDWNTRYIEPSQPEN